MASEHDRKRVTVPAGEVELEGDLTVPEDVGGVVVFAHGSGSSRLSPRNRFVAEALNDGGLATLLFDLLTPEEERVEAVTRHLRFDIELLSRRLSQAVDWVVRTLGVPGKNVGTFGASTGAAAALIAAAERPGVVGAVVSRGGRPDLAGAALPRVEAPTLLIVGGRDPQVLELNREAADRMEAFHRIDVIPGATHLFEEPGALERVAELARNWFVEHLVHHEQPA